jgi:hypothetical protein
MATVFTIGLISFATVGVILGITALVSLAKAPYRKPR